VGNGVKTIPDLFAVVATTSTGSGVNEVGDVMMRRCIDGYGMDIQLNDSLTEKQYDTVSFDVNFAWKWMRRMEELANSNSYAAAGLRPEHPYQFGVNFCLNLIGDGGADRPVDMQTVSSELCLPQPGLGDETVPSDAVNCTVYGGVRRQLVMRMCGWDALARVAVEDRAEDAGEVATVDQQADEEGLLQLEADGKYGKAAAFAVFAFDLQRAVQSLNKAANIAAAAGSPEFAARLRLAGLALGGYTGTPNTQQMKQWQETCEALGVLVDSRRDTQPVADTTQGQFVDDPYIRMAFLFLACHATGAGRGSMGEADVARGEPGAETGTRDFSAVTHGSTLGLSLYDRIAFSCRFMDDSELTALLKGVQTETTARGMLSGFVLTGLTADAMPLLQNFVDRSADIQTAVLLMCHVVPRRFSQSAVEAWIAEYRDLLDRWQLWHERCLLDICLVPYSGKKPPPQIFARCQFCNQSLAFTSTPREGSVIRQVKLASGQQPSLRLPCCPACKKPLPRCAVCLEPLDCANPTSEDTKQYREMARRLATGVGELEPWRCAEMTILDMDNMWVSWTDLARSSQQFCN
jgi:hypothetical protein